MARRDLLVILLITGVTSALPLLGCQTLDTRPTPVEVEIAESSSGVEIRLARSLPLVPVIIHGHGPYWMLLDTGSDETVLDDRVADEIKLPTVDRYAVISSGGHTRRMNTPQGRLDEVTIGDAVFRDFDVMVSDLSALSRTLRHRLDGIIGVKVISQSVVTIDYAQRRAYFSRQRLEAPDGVSRLPLAWRGSEAVVELRVAGKPIRAKLDTGQVGSLSLSEDDRAALGEVLIPRGSVTHRTFTGSVERDVVRLNGRIRVGMLEIQDPHASIGGRTRLGSGALRHSLIRIDLRGGVLEIIPGERPVRSRPWE